MIDIDKIADVLGRMSLNEGGSERIREDESFEDQDAYKISYRFVNNLGSNWKVLGFDKFPTLEECVEIAKKAHPFFIWMFEKNIYDFEVIYDGLEDIWGDIYLYEKTENTMECLEERIEKMAERRREEEMNKDKTFSVRYKNTLKDLRECFSFDPEKKIKELEKKYDGS